MKHLFYKNLNLNEQGGGGEIPDDQKEFAEIAEKINFNKTQGKIDLDDDGDGGEPGPGSGDPEGGDPEGGANKPGDGDGKPGEGDGDDLDFSKGDPEGDDPEGGDPEGGEGDGDDPDEGEIDLSEIGEYEDIDSLKSDLAELKELREYKTHKESEEPPKIEFENDQQKKLYEYAKNFKGNEVEAMQQYLHVQGLNLDNLSGKELLFEAFNLDPKYKNIPAAERRGYFDAKYEKEYGNMDEDDVMAKTELRIAEDEARDKISGLKEDYAEAQSKSAEDKPGEDPDQIIKVMNDTKEALKDYQGSIEVSIGEGIDKVSVDVNNDAEKIAQDVSDVGEMWNREMILSGAVDEKGNVDLSKYSQVVNEFVNRQKIYEKLYSQGAEDREIMLRKKFGKPSSSTTAPGGSSSPESKESKGDQQDLLESIKKAEG